jgi:hypothetical protein
MIRARRPARPAAPARAAAPAPAPASRRARALRRQRARRRWPARARDGREGRGPRRERQHNGDRAETAYAAVAHDREFPLARAPAPETVRGFGQPVLGRRARQQNGGGQRAHRAEWRGAGRVRQRPRSRSRQPRRPPRRPPDRPRRCAQTPLPAGAAPGVPPEGALAAWTRPPGRRRAECRSRSSTPASARVACRRGRERRAQNPDAPIRGGIGTQRVPELARVQRQCRADQRSLRATLPRRGWAVSDPTADDQATLPPKNSLPP